MTTYAAPIEQETAALDISSEDLIVETVPLLDNRTSDRLVTPRVARRGPHLALQHDGETWLVPLEAKITHIGRGLTAHIRFEDQRVSRDHAIIVRHGRFARVLDNRSAHGTYLNGRRVIATNVNDGDVLRFGPVPVQYVEVE